jgi:hypothetical protein
MYLPYNQNIWFKTKSRLKEEICLRSATGMIFGNISEEEITPYPPL